ncbi:NAD(P)-binding domain-containing protein [Nocardia sp. NPDC058176]|uniref:NAD(P)-binding domain-containing protein n=1 Tax=Nocardia sp. NPDC058176 TaxID=3346368 RepID=UPI0036DBFC26
MGKQEFVDRAAAEQLRLLGADPANWVVPIPGVDHDVAVIGGGQSGIAIAFALRRAGITNVTVLDAADDETSAGVWSTLARMRTLRTPKDRSGPELGIPALGFRAWYEGLHGTEAFDAIGRIARTDWAEYLAWFRRQTGIEVRYRTRLTDLARGRDAFELTLVADGVERVETARKVVFATGVEGSGGPNVPAIFDALPAGLYAHTGQAIDAESLAGRTVGVLGAGASALDAAAVALEAGATEVHLFSRRSELVIQPTKGSPPGFGAVENFHLQSDAVRWKSRLAFARKGASSPWDSVSRVLEFPNFALHLDAPWQELRAEDGRVVVRAADGVHTFDFVIAGTGYQYDPATRTELTTLAPEIALWSDIYEPPAEQRSEAQGRAPYLGPGYELTAKTPGRAPWLADIHVFAASAAQSFGRPVGDIPSLGTGVPRLVTAIARDLYFAGVATPGTAAATEPESFYDKYSHSIWRSAELAESPAS